MGARKLWIVAAVFCLLSVPGCKSCKEEGGEQTKAKPVATARPPDRPKPPPTPADAGAPPAADAEGEPEPVVKHQTIQMPDVTAEEMNDPSFPKNITPQARRAIIRLKKLQQTDPHFKHESSGVPTPPPEAESALSLETKKKDRKHRKHRKRRKRKK